MARQLGDACTTIRIHLRTRRQRQRRTPDTPASLLKKWTEKWIGQPVEQWDEREKPRVLADWTDRWKKDQRKQERVVRPGTDPGGNYVVPEDPPSGRQVLKLHAGLKKAGSLMLVQARTGRVGLATVRTESARNTDGTMPLRSWRRNGPAYGIILYRRNGAPAGPTDERGGCEEQLSK
jgi:hypothetical protein